MFAELLAKTTFSFLEGASEPREVVEQAHALGLGAVGVVDRDGLYGMARAYHAQRKLAKDGSATKLLVGAELCLSSGISAGGIPRARPRISLIAMNQRGYANLCQLITRSFHGRPKGEPELSIDHLSSHAAGLFAFVTAPYDQVLAEHVREVFADRAMLVAHRHGVADDRARDRAVKRVARRLRLPVVASARPLYHDASRRPVADVLACIRLGTTLDEAGTRISPNAEARMRDEGAMLRLFADQPSWVHLSGEIAQACDFSPGDLDYRFPCLCIRPGETADQALARLVGASSPWRYPDGVPESVHAQLTKELHLIEALGVAPYFLCVHEIVEMARARGILCQGRGSAANSAVCFVLGITSVDPARTSLLFERFLSAERNEPPDIDVDFEHERREEVIQEIYRRYGRDRAAMVSEVISYRGKSALGEVGKAFGLSPEQTSQLSGLLLYGDSALPEARLREAGLDPTDRRLAQVLKIAGEIQGFPRHLSVHTGGFVLSEGPLADLAPIEPARMENRTVVQWDKDDIDTLGFFKVDVLALGMLTAIRKALALVTARGDLPGFVVPRELGAVPREPEAGLRTGPAPESSGPFDAIRALALLPPEDPAVYAAFSRADTVGVFQIESRAQMAMLPNLRPRSFYDLVIEVAIVRPGPIQGGMVHPYLRRRGGEEPVVCPHPSLAPILERTLGVPLFQEQVMQIAIVGAGYTGGEADELRRDMAAWKKTGALLRHREKLLDGFRARGIAPEFAEALFKQIQGFGEYGFPESHAASFALLVYASGWLKVHFPAAFACALINSQPMGFYSASAIVQDAQRHGVVVRPVCVMSSEWDATLEGETAALRLGMRLLVSFPESAARAIELARATRPFVSVRDLAFRAGLGRREITLLAEAGALLVLVPGRREALWEARAPEAPGLFARLPLEEPPPRLARLSPVEQLTLDYARTGLSIDDHPMRHVRVQLEKKLEKVAPSDRNQSGRPRTHRLLRAVDLVTTRHRTKVSVAGLVQSRQRPGTASGVVFVTLEDETGSCNVVLWSTVFEAHRFVAVHAQVLLVHGTLERSGTIVHVIAERLERLDQGDTVRVASRDFH